MYLYTTFKTLGSIIMALFTLLTGCSTTSSSVPTDSKKTEPLNIIFLIGDGMGLSQVSSAFYYQQEASNFQRLTTIGLINTSSGSEKITDSAAGATAFASGVKTYNGAIGVDMDTAEVKTLVEIASGKGIGTGIIATSAITHATPAAFFSHERSRKRQEEIATWLPKSGVDYFAAGGLEFFNQRTDSVNYLTKLKEMGFEIDTTSLGADQPLAAGKKYGRLLAADGLPSMQEGRGDFLPKATAQALSYLSKFKQGFFLMIEGSQIDWGGHQNDSEYLISEVLDFDQTIGVALDFAQKSKNTLVVVTADHETGGFTLASSTTKDENGKVISTDYNVIAPSFSTGGHSSTLVPVFAYGPGSEQFSGIYQNTDIFHKFKAFITARN